MSDYILKQNKNSKTLFLTYKYAWISTRIKLLYKNLYMVVWGGFLDF